ncbi:MAG: hypothetical protein HOA17_01785 [Candidatus Melainabacteria bacterium]|jgi:hypothetical protein|nr:hypothetical protein [Candidatus Melainabacteria bacterium]
MVAIGNAAPTPGLGNGDDRKIIIGKGQAAQRLMRPARDVAELVPERPTDERLVRAFVKAESPGPVKYLTRNLKYFFKTVSPNTEKELANYIFILADTMRAVSTNTYADDFVSMLIQAIEHTSIEGNSIEDVLQPYTQALNQAFRIARIKSRLLIKESREDLSSLAHNLIDLHCDTISRYKVNTKGPQDNLESLNPRLSKALSPVIRQFPPHYSKFTDAHEAFDFIMERNS